MMPDLAMNKGKYPDATPDAMPELAQPQAGSPEAQAQQDATQVHPVIGALQTIAAAIAAKQQQGDPQAQAMMDMFKKLLEAFGAGGQQAGQQPPQSTDQQAPAPDQSAPPTGSKPMGGATMNSAKQGAVPLI
jgi:hypothetical protein